MNIVVQTVGFDKVQAYFADSLARSKNLAAPLTKGGNVMLRSVDNNFASGGRPRIWAPLKAATVRRKARKGQFLTLVGDTGKLRSEISFDVDGNSLKVGTNIPYGRVHQLGGGNNIPARPYLVFQKRDIDQINRLVMQHITQKE